VKFRGNALKIVMGNRRNQMQAGVRMVFDGHSSGSPSPDARENDSFVYCSMGDDPIDAVLKAVGRAAEGVDRPAVLAVSGGLDSMVLLHAAAEVIPSRIAAVATFDHGTGPAAMAGVRHVRAAASAVGFTFVSAKLPSGTAYPNGREAAWRAARYAFLQATAAHADAAVMTAHTEDDQVETVLLRVMRGSGARGLSALYAPSRVIRPLIRVRRATLEAYAAHAGISWVVDPSNVTRAYARNRVRLDLLPAFRHANADFDGELLALAKRADVLRRDVESFVDRAVRPTVSADGDLIVASRELMDHDADSHAMLWPALAGRVGLALDARGIRRIAAFASARPRSGSIPLAGGWCLEATRDAYILFRQAAPVTHAAVTLPAEGSVVWAEFRFRVVPTAMLESPWGATLSLGDGAVVRQWAAGDRLEAAGGQQPRRVKRYLSDAGVRGSVRTGWPVVVAGHDIVWIPGVRRSDAATDRSGRPARHYICERNDR
jgi:tRNA(Ile)-lysidine synthase